MVQKTLGTNSLLPEVSVSGAFRFPPAKGCSSMRKVVASGCLGKNVSFETVPDIRKDCNQFFSAELFGFFNVFIFFEGLGRHTV